MAYQTSQGLASLGRNGDSVLVHMNPTEVAGLQGLAMAQGGSLTINPHTGLPEAFNLGGFFKSLLPTIVGGAASMIPGLQFASYPMLTGILAGAATGAVTNKEDPLMGGLLGGLGGYSGAGIMGAGKTAAGAMGSVEAAKTAATNAGIGGGSSGLATGGGYIPGATSGADLAYNNAMMAAQTGGVTNSAISGASGAMDIDKLLAAGKPIGMANTAASTASLPPNPTFLGNVGQAIKGIGGAATGNQAAVDAYTTGIGAKTGMGALGRTALPVGGALLGGLEPSDIYGKPINMDEAKKKQAYDPYATLNLSGDTGLRLYATGGTVQSGGIRDLYGTPDNQPTISPGLSGFGLGRLNNLAGEQAMAQAQTLGYAMGGPVSFADGGDSNKEDAMGLPSLSPDMSMSPNTGANNSAMIQSVMGAMQPTQGMQGSSSMAQGQMPDQSNDSLIAKVTANLRADPNYQPTNPIEAAIAKQIRGTDPMQQGEPSQQGLGSLTPSQPSFPTAATYNPSVAMGPTYFAGMNAPKGYAEGGETSLNLDALPSLNLNFVTNPSEKTSSVPDYGRMGPFGGKAPVDSPFGGKAQNMRLGSMDVSGFVGLQNALNRQQVQQPTVPKSYALNLNSGQQEAQYARGGYLNGQGDGMSDSIPATIEGKQPARLADGEFVVPADVVSHLGNGSSKAGSKRLYAMLDKVRHARTGNKKQGKQINPAKYMPA